MKAALPEAYDQLVETMQRLEEHYREIRDIEFTVEDGRLYLLQTRSGKQAAQAALRIAVEMVDEGLITKDEAVANRSASARPASPSDDRPAGALRSRREGAQRFTGAATGKIILDARPRQRNVG